MPSSDPFFLYCFSVQLNQSYGVVLLLRSWRSSHKSRVYQIIRVVLIFFIISLISNLFAVSYYSTRIFKFPSKDEHDITVQPVQTMRICLVFWFLLLSHQSWTSINQCVRSLLFIMYTFYSRNFHVLFQVQQKAKNERHIPNEIPSLWILIFISLISYSYSFFKVS